MNILEIRKLVEDGTWDAGDLTVALHTLLVLYDKELTESFEFQGQVESYLNDTSSEGYEGFVEYLEEI